MPLKVSVSKAFELLGSDIVVEILSEWVSPAIGGSNLTEGGVGGVSGFLSSDVVFWSIWLVRTIRVLSA